MQGTYAGHVVGSDTKFPFLKLYIFTAIVMLAADWIGSVTFNVGPGKVVLLPMVWAIIMGGLLGVFRQSMPPLFRVDTALQFRAAAVLQPALLLFIAKLGLMVGNSLPKLAAAGWALAFQELGHFVGTILIGLPLALLLGIKREAIGATFSVGREPSLAIIGERYGMDSPEGRGVLAEYLTGTLFGAVFIAVLAGFVASLNIFHPISLAMGSGVGSGSMMAAASGAIAAQQTPEVAKDVMTFAAASNLITTTIGTYFTLFISLPLAVYGYRFLEPILGRTTKASTDQSKVSANDHAEVPELSEVQKWGVWIVAAGLTMVSDRILYGTSLADTFPGMVVMLVAVAIGDLLARITGRKIPAVCWVSLVAMAITSPLFPWDAQMVAITGKINFLAVTPVMLTFAGLSLAKDLPAFRRLGWRIVLVSFAANAGTFLGATLVAEFFHR
ncbi:DUF3100 domain-containing protein [Herbaspirillum sp. DW155]|uniref:DUF3100 domain-containing protein n=1 Tax=Herbaspirillum sp. DW155 TaxID=3095609 RepID=UPI00309206D6|nr:DUF3100 domain-containing protein [Herbaspirillum sp. DW155]